MAEQDDSMEEQKVIAVDETPIAPSRPDHGRKNSLIQHLAHRPDRAELVEKNILPASTAAPGLLEKQKELERHMRIDTLKDKIANRPPPEKLVREGLLRADPRSPGGDGDDDAVKGAVGDAGRAEGGGGRCA